MAYAIARLVEPAEASWIEEEFNARWPWPRRSRFVADRIEDSPHIVAVDVEGMYLGHCHIRQSRHQTFQDLGIPEIADLNVMPDCRRRGAASAILDRAESLIAETSEWAGIGVGIYGDYGPAQRLYTARGYILDGTGAWSGATSVRGGATIRADDDLMLYLTKKVQ